MGLRARGGVGFLERGEWAFGKGGSVLTRRLKRGVLWYWAGNGVLGLRKYLYYYFLLFINTVSGLVAYRFYVATEIAFWQPFLATLLLVPTSRVSS